MHWWWIHRSALICQVSADTSCPTSALLHCLTCSAETCWFVIRGHSCKTREKKFENVFFFLIFSHIRYLPLSLLDLSSSPPGPYHQDAYVPKQEEKFKSPPILPPHLLQVILNKDTGISVSNPYALKWPSYYFSFFPNMQYNQMMINLKYDYLLN